MQSFGASHPIEQGLKGADLKACSQGREGAELLGHTIWWHFHERMKAKNDLRLVHLSCHDYTIAALAAHLGAHRRTTQSYEPNRDCLGRMLHCTERPGLDRCSTCHRG